MDRISFSSPLASTEQLRSGKGQQIKWNAIHCVACGENATLRNLSRDNNVVIFMINLAMATAERGAQEGSGEVSFNLQNK